jgi:hypothetical protein
VLNDLLNEEMSAKEKMRTLAACGIKVTREIETEVDRMTTYTASILRKGRAEGRAEMIEQMLVSGKTPEEISSFTGIPLEEIKAVEKSMCVNA